MRIIETKVYQFNELSEETQEKVIENFRNDPYYIDYDWYEFEIDYWKEKLNDIGFENADIRFSGFYSQGDGASFTSDIDLEKIINHMVYCSDKFDSDIIKYLAIEKQIYHGLIELDLCVKNSTSRYCHENTCYVDFNFYLVHDNISQKATVLFESFLEQLESNIEDLRLDLCHKIYSSLEKEYKWLLSDEQIKEHIIINEYEFTENGEMV